MSTADLVERFAAGPRLVREAVAGMSPEQLRARPVPGKWSTLEVVAHLADFEFVFVDRLSSVIAEHEPTLPGRNEQQYVARLAYAQRDLEEELRAIDACRGHMTRILRTLGPGDWSRRGLHTEAGPLALDRLLERCTSHIEHHVPFIQAKRAALGE